MRPPVCGWKGLCVWGGGMPKAMLPKGNGHPRGQADGCGCRFGWVARCGCQWLCKLFVVNCVLCDAPMRCADAQEV